MSRRVAVIGASTDRRKYGNKAVRAFASQGYDVVPVNPHEPSIEGLTTYPSVLAVPGAIDMATMYVPPDVGLQVIEDIARKNIPEVWFNPGSASDALVARAQALGLNAIEACSIMGIGDSPGRY
jgi:predicted CoA-binding protein